MFNPPPPGPLSSPFTAANNATPPPTFLEAWGKQITSVRDIFLVMGGFLFVSGFLMTQYNAWRMNLGFISLSPAQYILAGALPFCILVTLVVLVIIGDHITLAIARWVSAGGNTTTYQKRSTGVRNVLWCCFVLSMIGVLTISFWERVTGDTTPDAVIFWPYAPVLTMVFLLTVRSHITENGAIIDYGAVKLFFWKKNFIDNMMTLIFPVVIGVFLIHWSITMLHPDWPQEFGGLKPRMAYLDVSRGMVSDGTRFALLPEKHVDIPKGTDPKPVVTTKLMDVVFETGDYFLVTPHIDYNLRVSSLRILPAFLRDNPIFRLRKDTVTSVLWVGYTEPEHERKKREAEEKAAEEKAKRKPPSEELAAKKAGV